MASREINKRGRERGWNDGRDGGREGGREELSSPSTIQF